MPARTPLEPTSRAHATLGLARAETRREKLGRIRAGFEEHPRCESQWRSVTSNEITKNCV